MTGLGGHKIAYFEEIFLLPVSELSSRVAGLRTGEYDFAEALPPTQFDTLSADPAIELHVMTLNAWPALEFNHAAEWTDNLQFRQAIQAALNMEEILMAVTSGRTEFFRLNPSVFFNEQPWWNEAGAELYNQHDLEKARRLLEEAGYAGEEIVLLTNRDYDYMYRTALTAAQQLEAVGINVDVQVYDWPGQRAVNANPTGWQINTSGYTPRFDPSAYTQSWHSLARRYGYANPEMDRWFELGAAAQEFGDRYEYYSKVQEEFYRDVTTIKIGDFFALEGTRNDITGFRPWLTARFWNVQRQ
jgi:peptide/nickel transport system substrate-binding protein